MSAGTSLPRRQLVELLGELQELQLHARRGTLTLVYRARDTERNDAALLAELLRNAAEASSADKEDR